MAGQISLEGFANSLPQFGCERPLIGGFDAAFADPWRVPSNSRYQFLNSLGRNWGATTHEP